MEFRRSICFSLTLLYLFHLVDFVWSRRCSNPPECKLGTISMECKCIPCPPNKYSVVRSGHRRCEFCTQQCSAERHLIQIKDCTANSNRECHCERGYFCESAAQYTCRRCTPCPDGTFTDTTSRLQSESCKQHTDCGSLGMALISTGNRNHDNVCAYITTSFTPSSTLMVLHVVQNAMEQNSVIKETTVPPSTAFTKVFALETETVTNMRVAQTAIRYHSKRAIMSAGPKMSPRGLSAPKTPRGLTTTNDGPGVQSATKQNSGVKEIAALPSSVSAKSFALETETVTSMWDVLTTTHYLSKSDLIGAESDPMTSAEEQPAHNFQSWPLIVLFMILVVLLGFGKCYRNRTSQKKCQPLVENGQWGSWRDRVTLDTMKHLLSEGGPSPSALHPLVSKKGEGLGLDGAESGHVGLRQVTVDHSGGRENVSNTVGSIFIYSPGTVILGTSASEQKGEAGEQPEEDDKNPEEGPNPEAVTSAPQQESLEESRRSIYQDRPLQGGPGRGSVEEVEKRELCYPIPATGK